MSPIEKLPTEIIQHIAELCTWDSAAPENGFPSQVDRQRYRREHEWHPRTYARYHAYFARTSRHFYGILNERLYKRNLTRDPDSCSCVFWAIKNNRLETIQRAHEFGDLSSYRPYVEPIRVPSQDDYTITWDHINVNGVLVPYDHRRPSHLVSPLHDATVRGLSKIVAFLLEVGVAVEKEGSPLEEYPLQIALTEDFEEIAEMLVDHGAYLSQEGFSALPAAYTSGFQGVIETLLQKDDPISLVGKLHLGALSHNLELVTQSTQDSNVNINARDIDGNTALDLAIQATGGIEVVEYLLQRPGIEFDIPNGHGRVPFHVAASSRRTDIVRLLAEMPGFDVNRQTRAGTTALDIAIEVGDRELFAILMEHPGLQYPQAHDMRIFLDTIFFTHDDVTASHFSELLLRECPYNPDLEYDIFMLVISRGYLLTASALLPHMSDFQLFGLGLAGPDGSLPLGPLHYVLMMPHHHQPVLVRELLARGADIEATPTYHPPEAMGDIGFAATPLFYATVFAQSAECMEILIEAGASTTPLVQVGAMRNGEAPLTMSLLSGLFSNAWGEPWRIVDHPILFTHYRDSSIVYGMDELKNRVSMLLQHGATLNNARGCISALDLACNQAARSASCDFLKWLTDTATTNNVDVEHVDSILSQLNWVEDEPVQNVLRGFKGKAAARRKLSLAFDTWSSSHTCSNALSLAVLWVVL
ncbi:unnamed protein product [Clonostachys rosea]|uniref:F-box domain-containing protein n=1 Tax=Bionectria ochroleuca TaxID=29856 RepID=A0ABY6U4I9_BIOOC|nr:unnamed protein product [Clonostachys rosea]